ncbi:hypothetical protein BHE74_00006987 [Ensete ventricosum]|nr:hypothetical protein GW17_00031291 [Ensete ventricosum]RWW84406.1 hypothetical protein BHE74_00006987 [Ensete ventricosum]
MTLADPREINYATPLRTNHASIPHATPGGPRGRFHRHAGPTPGERAAGRAVPSVVVAIAAAVSQEGAERSVSVCGRGWRRGYAAILWIPKIQGGKMRSKAGGRAAAFSSTKESPPPAEKAAEWEVRPCGMLVQKRGADADATATPVPTIRVKVKHGSVYHEIYVSSQATFGELKKALSAKTGLHPLDMKLLYKDKERESTAFLDTAGVKDKSKVVLEEDPTAQAKRLLEMRKTDKMEKAAKSIAAISLEVDRLASKIKRVQKYVETLDAVKIKNAMPRAKVQPSKEQTQQRRDVQPPQHPIQQQKRESQPTQKPYQQQNHLQQPRVVVTTKWETFDSLFMPSTSTSTAASSAPHARGREKNKRWWLKLQSINHDLNTSARGPLKLNLSTWTRQPKDHVSTPGLLGHIDSYLGKRGRLFTQCRLLRGSYCRSVASSNETPRIEESSVPVPTGQPKVKCKIEFQSSYRHLNCIDLFLDTADDDDDDDDTLGQPKLRSPFSSDRHLFQVCDAATAAATAPRRQQPRLRLHISQTSTPPPMAPYPPSDRPTGSKRPHCPYPFPQKQERGHAGARALETNSYGEELPITVSLSTAVKWTDSARP